MLFAIAIWLHMVDTSTSHYGLVKPQIHGSPETWGTKLNDDMDAIDNILFRIDNTGATNLAAQVAALGSNVPINGIVMYDGLLSALPANWKVCDGTDGTQDLRNLFIVGAGDAFTCGMFGGNAFFSPTISDVDGYTLTVADMPWHDHDFYQWPHGHGTSNDSHTHGGGNHHHGGSLLVDTGAATGKSLYAFGPGTIDIRNTADATIVTDYVASGVTINGGTANIQFNAKGGNTPHRHSLTSEYIPMYGPFYAVYYIKRVA